MLATILWLDATFLEFEKQSFMPHMIKSTANVTKHHSNLFSWWNWLTKRVVHLNKMGNCWVTRNKSQLPYTQGAKPQFFGKPDMACCKRLCNKNIIHGPSGVNWSCTTLKICYWIGVLALITVPPSMTKRCCIKSQHNGQVYVIYLFLINLVHFIGTNIMTIVQ